MILDTLVLSKVDVYLSTCLASWVIILSFIVAPLLFFGCLLLPAVCLISSRVLGYLGLRLIYILLDTLYYRAFQHLILVYWVVCFTKFLCLLLGKFAMTIVLEVGSHQGPSYVGARGSAEYPDPAQLVIGPWPGSTGIRPIQPDSTSIRPTARPKEKTKNGKKQRGSKPQPPLLYSILLTKRC